MPVLEKTAEIFRQKVDYAKKNAVGNFTILPVYQPIPALFAERGKQKGGNVLGYDGSKDLFCKASPFRLVL